MRVRVPRFAMGLFALVPLLFLLSACPTDPGTGDELGNKVFEVDIHLTNQYFGLTFQGGSYQPKPIRIMVDNEQAPCCEVAPAATRSSVTTLKRHDTVSVRTALVEGGDLVTVKCTLENTASSPVLNTLQATVVVDVRDASPVSCGGALRTVPNDQRFADVRLAAVLPAGTCSTFLAPGELIGTLGCNNQQPAITRLVTTPIVMATVPGGTSTFRAQVKGATSSVACEVPTGALSALVMDWSEYLDIELDGSSTTRPAFTCGSGFVRKPYEVDVSLTNKNVGSVPTDTGPPVPDVTTKVSMLLPGESAPRCLVGHNAHRVLTR